MGLEVMSQWLWRNYIQVPGFSNSPATRTGTSGLNDSAVYQFSWTWPSSHLFTQWLNQAKLRWRHSFVSLLPGVGLQSQYRADHPCRHSLGDPGAQQEERRVIILTLLGGWRHVPKTDAVSTNHTTSQMNLNSAVGMNNPSFLQVTAHPVPLSIAEWFLLAWNHYWWLTTAAALHGCFPHENVKFRASSSSAWNPL